jgi:hypothetical protein
MWEKQGQGDTTSDGHGPFDVCKLVVYQANKHWMRFLYTHVPQVGTRILSLGRLASHSLSNISATTGSSCSIVMMRHGSACMCDVPWQWQ